MRSVTDFQLQPNLEGDLLRLRPLLPEHFDALFSVAKDPLIWEQHPSSDRYQEAVFREFFRAALESGGAFLILDAKTGEVIGSSRFVNFRKHEIEIGYTFLARRCWGHTYNRELKRLMLQHAFQFVENVAFVIGENNGRSRAAIEKIGATLENTAPRSGAVRYRLARAEVITREMLP
jgi:RimJ/RimL family protein N-acetyltransferase